MTADWVGVAVRARGMTCRCLTRERIREVAASPTLESALKALSSTQYAQELGPSRTLSQAQRLVTATLLWNLRVLAGWAPRQGVAMLRALLGGFEISNVVEHLLGLAGAEQPGAYQLGALATAWPRLQATASGNQLRQVLATSTWGDPGGDKPEDIRVAMHASLYDRIIAAVPAATSWAGAATVLLVAREHFVSRQTLSGPARVSAARVIGGDALSTATLEELAAAVPSTARWVLAEVSDPSELWAAEARWWGRLARDGRRLTQRGMPAAKTLAGAAALLAADAWRVRVALELADRGGGPLEFLDAVV